MINLRTHSTQQEVASQINYGRKEKATQAVKTFPVSIVKRIRRPETPCIPFTKRKDTEVNGVQESNEQYSLPDLVMRVERSLLKSASGASKSISVLDGMSTKLKANLVL
eukprot:1159018-Pelagomonas_calceolata.AAC.8